jgi:hypothetical protein
MDSYLSCVLTRGLAGLGQKIRLTPCPARKERECMELALFQRETRCFTMQVANHFQGKRTYSEQSIFYLGVDSEVSMALSKDRRSVLCDPIRYLCYLY